MSEQQQEMTQPGRAYDAAFMELHRQALVARVEAAQGLARIFWLIASILTLGMALGVTAGVIAIIRWIADVG